MKYNKMNLKIITLFILAFNSSLAFANYENDLDYKSIKARNKMVRKANINTEKDYTLTNLIRNDLNYDTTFSSNVKNINITTIEGKVTLSGFTRDENERERIANYARARAGSNNVTNNLMTM